MAPAKKLKKPKGKSKGKLNTTRTVKKVDRETNRKLKMNWELCEETRRKKRNRERKKAWKERKKVLEKPGNNTKK